MIGLAPAVVVVAIASALCAGCGSDVAHVELVVVRHPDGCGQVPNADAFTITALGESGEVQINFSPGEAVFVDSFPGDTRQLALAVRAGAVESFGKTAPFSFDDVTPTVPISIAPLEGTCPVGPLVHARRRPQVIAAGEGAIVVGGSRLVGAALEPVAEIEYFDPRTNTFSVVQADPPGVRAGLRGGSLVALTDGRIVFVAGLEGDYGVFDPDTRTFPTFTSRLPDPQALAATAAIDDHRIAIAGGCAVLAAGHDHACAAGQTLARVLILDIDANTVTPAPDLLVARANATASLQFLAGAPVIAVAGGVDGAGVPVDSIELVPLAGNVTPIFGGGGLGVALDAGGMLTALAPPGAPASALAGVAVPGVVATRPVADTEARADAVLVPLEDGTVVSIGGLDMGGQPALPVLYRPLQGSWREVVDARAPPLLLDHAAARLPDGSVLVVGGRDAADADVASAWRFRPSLIGPFAGSASVSPVFPTDVPQLSVLDPGLTERTGTTYQLQSAGAAANIALVSGPRQVNGALTAAVRIGDSGGFSLIARATGPGDRIEAVIEPRASARVDRVAAGVRTTIPSCIGGVVPILAGTAGVEITMTIVDDHLTVQRTGDAADISGCDLGPGAPGLWGIAAVGDGTQIDIDTITVER